MRLTPLVAEALRLEASGFSVLATGQDKRPLGKWTLSQQQPATPETLRVNFRSPQATGCAVVTGLGGLVSVDFDHDKHGAALEPYDLRKEFVEPWQEAIGDIAADLPCQRTGGGGYQFFFRCPDPIGNTKLAKVPVSNHKGCHAVIETRGRGGYALVPPSLHPSGNLYTYEHLDLTDAPMLTQEQADRLIAEARALDRMPLENAQKRRLVRDYQQRQGEMSEVIGGYNEANDPEDILERNGYVRVRDKYRSPDSTSGNAGTSVLEGDDGRKIIYSHHGDALGDGHAHDAFDVFAILEHDGDKKAAYRAAAQELGLWQEAPPRRKSTTATPDRQTRTPAGDDDPRPDLLQFNRTDYGAAERLHALYGHTFRHCAALGFLVWDGRRWVVDEGEVVMLRLAFKTTRELFKRASLLQDSDLRAGWVTHSLARERSGALKAAVELAKTIPGVAVEVSELDADPMLLNVENGTLDLSTGTLKPHDPRDLITKLAPVTFDPSAECSRWLEFQQTICADDDDFIAFKQRAYGYSATGNTSEHCLFIPYGTGANGKSTELDTIGALLGDYANTAQFDSFAVKKSEGVRDDIADLMGARFVSASEGERRQHLAEGLIKQMTGGDTLKARRLYGSYFRFKPAFKLWLATNHKPVIKGVDEGIWRRVRLIPYAVTIHADRRDKTLKDKLEAERSGILNWLLEGCRLWLEAGLGEADAVREATENYRQESDVLAEFISARCAIDPLYSESAGNLYRAYETWCRDNSEEPMNNTAFGRTLNDRGYTATLARRGSEPVRLRNGLCLIEHTTERGEA